LACKIMINLKHARERKYNKSKRQGKHSYRKANPDGLGKWLHKKGKLASQPLKVPQIIPDSVVVRDSQWTHYRSGVNFFRTGKERQNVIIPYDTIDNINEKLLSQNKMLKSNIPAHLFSQGSGRRQKDNGGLFEWSSQSQAPYDSITREHLEQLVNALAERNDWFTDIPAGYQSLVVRFNYENDSFARINTNQFVLAYRESTKRWNLCSYWGVSRWKRLDVEFSFETNLKKQKIIHSSRGNSIQRAKRLRKRKRQHAKRTKGRSVIVKTDVSEMDMVMKSV